MYESYFNHILFETRRGYIDQIVISFKQHFQKE